VKTKDLKSRVIRELERFEAGRAFKARVRALMGEQPLRWGHSSVQCLDGITHLNVEASFLCNLRCRMCPRSVEGHTEGLMPMDRFHRLEHVFTHIDAVILTGYGEPLVHPELDEMISIIRNRGTRARLSTNGVLLTAERGRRLLDAGIENLQFSIDAGTRETFEEIRLGAKWDEVVENAEAFNRIRDESGLPVGTAWIFIVMRDNYSELPAAADLAGRLGFDLFVTKFIERNQLDFEQKQVVHDNEGRLLPDLETGVTQALEAASERAASHGMEIRVHDFFMGYEGACLADPLHAVFVDWLGNVTPCCHLPVRDGCQIVPDYLFGNVDEQDFVEILIGARARDFRAAWRGHGMPTPCVGCYMALRCPRSLPMMLDA
jgi:MoaA/NifB/PqqE/SkfB family radical SAM enzyme